MTQDVVVGPARPSRLPVVALPGRHERTIRFAFAPGLVLAVTADRATLEHFEAEYAPALERTTQVRRASRHLPGGPPTGVIRGAPSGSPAVDVSIRSGLLRAAVPPPLPSPHSTLALGSALTDGQRTTRWAVRLGDPEETPIRASVSVAGIFGRSFVQGFVVEPLLSVAAAREGRMLLPAAGLVLPEGLVLVLGRSHTGKTTLAARALAAGGVVLGDDQVILEPGGTIAFPRRMRLYPDLATTAPAAFRRLPPSTQLAIHLRRLVAVTGTRLPVLLRAADPLGAAADGARLPVARVVLVERSPASTLPADATRKPLETADLVDAALALADEQRARLRAGADPAWAVELDRTLERERAILAASLAGVPAERIVVPSGWPARRAIGALDAILGVGR